MAGEKNIGSEHRIELVERELLSVYGVHSLGSYDEKEIRMETADGVLAVQGDGMNIKQLNLEEGNVVIEGLIKGLVYDEKEMMRKGLWNRFLK